MKKKVYNLSNINFKQPEPKDPIINLCAKYGSMGISRKIGEVLKLKENRVAFVQDEERPKDWYIEIDNSSEGLLLRATRNNRFMFKCVQLVRQIYESVGLDMSKRYNMALSLEPTDDGLYAIITNSASARPGPKVKSSKLK